MLGIIHAHSAKATCNLTRASNCAFLDGVPVAQWLEHCVSSAKVVGSIPGNTHTDKKMYNLNAL